MPLGTTIPEAVKNIMETQRQADVDVDGHRDPFTLPGLEMRKRGAQGALPGMLHEFRILVENHAGAIVTSGEADAVKEFSDIADSEGPAIVVDADALYEAVADEVEKGLRTDRRFSSDTIMSFAAGLTKALDGLGVSSIPAPDFSGYMSLQYPTRADVVSLVEDALNQPNVEVGDELTAIYLQARVADEVLKAEFGNPFVPVVVNNARDAAKLAKFLFDGRNITFQVKAPVEPNDVVIAFNKLKAKQKKQQQKRNQQ